MIKSISKIALLLLITNGYAQTISLGSAINKAGRQRAITQRMAKDYMLIGADIRTEESTKDLDDATALFNENFHDLLLFAKTPDQKDALANVDAMWAKFRVKVTATPDLDNATDIITESTNLMKACNVVLDKIIEKNASNNKIAKLTAICGKERQNLQRISMLYTAKFWGVNYNVLDRELNEATTNFESTLITLISAPENTPEINTILKFQQSEWTYLKTTFDSENKDLKPSSVCSSTNLMFKDFNNLTSIYEKLVQN